jgi:hypothetical protein
MADGDRHQLFRWEASRISYLECSKRDRWILDGRAGRLVPFGCPTFNKALFVAGRQPFILAANEIHGAT